ncbi:MAG: ABC transporter permease [Bacteroidia bacterium]|nr:ABC transporter permease [Bacteroidia bacterium]
MNLPLHIAGRYLFAKKSHNVINVISAISSIGMAIGTAALVLILSVYNGFDGIVEKNLSDLDPDIRVSASKGRFFSADDPALDVLFDDGRVEDVHLNVQDNIFVNYEGKQGIAVLKGMDGIFGENSTFTDHIIEGEAGFSRGEIPLCSIGSSLASSLGAHTWFVTPLELYYPKRGAKISTLNPTASLNSVRIWPGSLFSISSDMDSELILVSYDFARQLFELEDDMVSSLEVTLKDGVNPKKFASSLQIAGTYLIQDRYQQHPAIYKMMKYEKFAIYLILIFVVVIIAFNIFGSLSMLIIEKKEDIATLRALGATDGLVRKIFVLEGWLVSLSGLAVGLVAGVGIALLQQRFGIVKMPAGFLVQAYPVVLKAADVLWTALGVGAIGFIISLCSVPKLK